MPGFHFKRLRDSLQSDVQSVPSALLADMEQLLTLLRDKNLDNSRLWSEVRDLRGRITNLRSWADASDQLLREERQLRRTEVEELRRAMRDLRTRLDNTESSMVYTRTALRDMQKRFEDTEIALAITRTSLATACSTQLALRRVLDALNEKLLALIRKKLGMEKADFWQMYAASNVGKIRGQPLEPIWQELQQEYGINEPADMYWRRLKGCKQPLDTYVHEENFDKLSYEELRAEGEVFYVGSKALYKSTFLEALELSKRISDATNTCMYDVDV